MTAKIIHRTCELDNCTRKHYAKGMCNIHYQRFMATGSTEKRAFPDVCTVGGCENSKKLRNGLCQKHYTRVIRHGSTKPTLIVNNDKKRLLANCKESESGCWEWKKYLKLGYGVTVLDGRLEQAHRASWKIFRSEIPQGMQINHKCHNRCCINPDHLYIGTQQDNVNDMIRAGRGFWQ